MQSYKDLQKLITQSLKTGFETNTTTISKFFENKYRLPPYQRNYSWEIDNVKELLDDIFSSVEQNQKFFSEYQIQYLHFLGVIVTQEKDKFYEIIDGQQRSTTLLLIFAAIDFLFQFISKTNGETKIYEKEKSLKVPYAFLLQFPSTYLDIPNEADELLGEKKELRLNLTSEDTFDQSRKLVSEMFSCIIETSDLLAKYNQFYKKFLDLFEVLSQEYEESVKTLPKVENKETKLKEIIDQINEDFPKLIGRKITSIIRI